MSYQVIFDKFEGALVGSLPVLTQGGTLEPIVILALYRDGTAVNLSAMTVSATMTDRDGDTTAVTGTLTGANGSFSWALSAGDVGTAGAFSVIVAYTDGTDTWASDPATMIILPNPAATASQNPALVTIPAADAAWLTAGAAGGAVGTAAYVDTIDEDDMASDSAAAVPTQQSVKAYVDAAVSGVASDVGDLTTTGLTSANMLRVASGGGLEERTPAQVAAAIQSSLSVGTSQLVHDNSLLTGLAYCFPLAESDGVRYDKVGAYALTDNNTVTQAAGVQGQAALFTAANSEYLSVASATQYQITGNTSFTFWLLPTSVSGTQGVFSKYGGTANEFVCQLASGQIRFTSYGGAADKTHSKVLAINTWYLIHIYIEGSTLGISVNNAAAETAAITGTIAASNSTFEIGAFSGAGRYLNGRLCNFTKHDKRLSALELSNFYNGGNGILYPFS